MSSRIESRIQSWQDHRGFGFAEPVKDGQRIFVHIKAFEDRQRRPSVGDMISFQLINDPEKGCRATHIRFANNRPATASSHSTPTSRNAKSGSSWGLFALASAVPLTLLVAALLGKVEGWLPAIYVGMSLLTFIAYGLDKRAAQSNSFRTPEKTLHTLELLGGWPGALVAQKLLRHKSSKGSYQAVFWLMVVLNLIGVAILTQDGESAKNIFQAMKQIGIGR